MNDEDLEKICQYYGIRKQLKKLSEEVFELQEAVMDTVFSAWDGCSQERVDHIAEELADVMVLWEQIKQHYDIPSQTIAAITTEKIERQLKRIEDEKGR